MMRKKFIIYASYLLVGVTATLLAFAVSVKVMGRSNAQEAEGEVPANATVAPAAEASAATPPAPGGASPRMGEADSGLATSQAPGEEDSISMLREFLEPFIYDSNNRRDPFEPFVDVRAAEVPEVLTGKFDTDDYQLVGIMWDIRDPKAMFLDPDRKVHIMSRDENIGRHNGYIAAIREGEVVVVESQKKQNDLIYKTKVIKISR